MYIAGPISRGDLARNINQATRAFRELAAAGFAPWCPHWSALSGEVQAGTLGPWAKATAAGCGLSHAEWLAVDLSWVEVADAVVRLPGDSVGADQETAHARARGIPVFGSVAMLVGGWADSLLAHRMHGGEDCPGPTLCEVCDLTGG